MIIKQLTTPNKSKRMRLLSDVTLGVIHYTGSLNGKGAVSWFQNPKANVSSHYVIDRDGTVYQFEDLQAILWHAGKSFWIDKSGCNNFSIGYELVGTADSGFTWDQYKVLNSLILGNMSKCSNLTSIVGHEHIAPGRKVDPGEHFFWYKIAGMLQDNPTVADRVKWLGGKPYGKLVKEDNHGKMEWGNEPTIKDNLIGKIRLINPFSA